jgi:hypothetical protein
VCVIPVRVRPSEVVARGTGDRIADVLDLDTKRRARLRLRATLEALRGKAVQA